MLAIAQKLGFKDLASFRASLKTNPKLHPASAQALLDAYQRLSEADAGQAAGAFWPLAQGAVRGGCRFPIILRRPRRRLTTRPARPTAAGPGRLFIDTYDATDRNLYSVEDIAYHEGIPGHHLQISIAQELTGLPEFRKYGATRPTVEGWGLYAEQLGKDVGFYQDPYSDYGRLEATSGAPSAWWSTPASTPRAGPASRWSITSTSTPMSTSPASSPKSTATSRGQARRWPTRLAQLKILELRDARAKGAGRQVRYSRLSRPGDRLGRLAAGRAGAAHRRLDRLAEARTVAIVYASDLRMCETAVTATSPHFLRL